MQLPDAAGEPERPPVARGQKRCILRLEGTVQTAGPTVLCIATATGGIHVIDVGKRTLFHRAGHILAGQGPLLPGTSVRVAFVTTDQSSLAVVIEVLRTPQAIAGRRPRPPVLADRFESQQVAPR